MKKKVTVGEEIEGTGYCVAGILFEADIAVSVDIEPVGSKFTSWQTPSPKGASRGYCFILGQTMKIGDRNVTLKHADEDGACFEVTDGKRK